MLQIGNFMYQIGNPTFFVRHARALVLKRKNKKCQNGNPCLQFWNSASETRYPQQ